MADTVRAPPAARQLPSWPARASRAAVELLHQRYGVRWLFADEQDQRLSPRLSAEIIRLWRDNFEVYRVRKM
jgi:hypothetical protein